MTFKKYLLFFFIISSSCFAKIKVITTTTDLAWLVRQIGGDNVQVESLLDGSEDPHFIDSMPHFINKVARAEMFCLIGLELEIGWVPKILAKSGNDQIQQGGKGYCETGRTVKALNVPKGRLNRSQGDIHAMGNPHYHLGPQAFIQGGETVLNTLINLRPDSAASFLQNFERLKKKVASLKKEINNILAPVKSRNLMEYHREFTYFFSEFNLNSIGAIELVPGVPPSAGRLARVSIQAKQAKVAIALASNTSPKILTDKFQAMSGTPVARVSMSILREGHPQNYEELLKTIAKAIVKQSKKAL